MSSTPSSISKGDAPEVLDASAEEKTFEPTSPPPPPDGGLQAWGLAVGCGLMTFCTFGFVNSFGVLQDYYQTHQLSHKDPSDIAWIGSLQTFLLFAMALFGGVLFDRYGGKVVWAPAIIYVFSLMMTSLATEYYQFMLAQGVLGGVSMSMVMIPAMAAIGQYFLKNRAAAMGVMVAGSSLGGVIWPVALSQMLANPRLGFGWSIRICAFIMLAVLLPSCAFVRARLPPRKGQLFKFSAFKEPFYVLTILGASLLLLAIFNPIFFLPSFARAHGMSARLAPYLVAIFNAASLFGRVIPGFLADRVGRFNVFFVAAVASGVLGFCWQACTSNASIIVFAALYGGFSGAVVSMFSTCLSMAAGDPREIGVYIGMGMGVASIASLIGAPISGAILPRGGYGGVADYTGAAALAGAVVLVLAKWKSGKGVFSWY